MKNLLANSNVLLASAALFVGSLLTQYATPANHAAPTSLSLIQEFEQASGPTIPPGPWDEDDSGSGESKIASGPTIPPGPWDEEDGEAGEPKIS